MDKYEFGADPQDNASDTQIVDLVGAVEKGDLFEMEK